MTAGLRLSDVLTIIANEIPTDQIAGLLRRLPARFYDPASQLFRPLAPAILLGLSLTPDLDDDDGLDNVVADMIELVGEGGDGGLELGDKLYCLYGDVDFKVRLAAEPEAPPRRDEAPEVGDVGGLQQPVVDVGADKPRRPADQGVVHQ
jgi:hypothetical protein